MAENAYIVTMDLRLYEAEASPALVAARYGLNPADIVDFSLNINPFGPPASSTAAAQAALGRCNEYPDLHLGALRRRLAERHDVPADALFFGAGLDDVLKLLLQAWTREGDRVLIHIPTFPRYELEAGLRGAKPVLVTSDPPWSISIDAIRKALRQNDIALAFLCTPNNPTGAVIAVDPIAALATEFPHTRFAVDEALINPFESGAMPLVKSHANIAVLRTFSKYFGLAGYRVGYAVANPARLKSLEVVRPPFNVALASAAAAEAVLDDHAFVDKTRQIFTDEVAYFRASLEKLSGCTVRGLYSNMVLIDLAGLTAASFVEALAKRAILVADGRSFHGLEDTQTVRISLRERAANERLLSAMREVL